MNVLSVCPSGAVNVIPRLVMLVGSSCSMGLPPVACANVMGRADEGLMVFPSIASIAADSEGTLVA